MYGRSGNERNRQFIELIFHKKTSKTLLILSGEQMTWMR